MKLMLYYITNEIRIRSKTSLLLWCYICSIFLIFLPNILQLLLFQQIFPIHSLLNTLFPVFLLFFPFNLDIFSRENNFNMLDYLVMNSNTFKKVYLARTVANAIIMLFPIIIGFLCLFIATFPLANPFITLQFLVFLIIVPFFFFSWFNIAVLILSIIELKFPNSLIRFILYLCLTFGIISSLSLINEIIANHSIIIGIFLGHQLFENLFVTIVEVSLSCIITQLMLPFLIALYTDRIINKVLEPRQEIKKKTYFAKTDLYSLLKIVGFGKKSSWQTIVPFLGSLLFLFLFISFPDSHNAIGVFIDVLGVYFFTILICVLFLVFPRITVERKFNMEEILLSRISVHSYFFEKLTILSRSIFYPILFTLISFILLLKPSFSILIMLVSFIIVHAFYFVSILLFIWRFFPTKTLLQSTFLSILGFEFIGTLVSNFLFPPDITNYNNLKLFFSPILSSLEMSNWIIDPTTGVSLWDSTWIILLLSIVFFLGALVLLKSETHFE